MLRFGPRARALLERARRPLTMLAIGAVLATPASAFIMREDAAGASPGTAARTSAGASGSGSMGSALSSAELAEARMTLGLSKLYSVPVGVAIQIQKAATTEGISPRLAFGLVHTESAFRRTAVSHVGAIGYTQVMPGTARYLKPGTTRSDLFDAETNLHLGLRYLKGLIERYGGDVRLALTAYNRGPGIVDRALKRGRNPENGYATKVLADPATSRQGTARARRATAPDAVRAGASRGTSVCGRPSGRAPGTATARASTRTRRLPNPSVAGSHRGTERHRRRAQAGAADARRHRSPASPAQSPNETPISRAVRTAS